MGLTEICDTIWGGGLSLGLGRSGAKGLQMMTARETRSKVAGFAFVAALMVLLVLAILVTGVLAMALSARQLTGSRQEYTQAIYLAESGINALISQWRSQGVADPPLQPYQGQLAGGSYSVTWEPHPTRPDVMIMTSVGTTNTDEAKFSQGSILRLTRTVRVNLDTDGDWAWDHVYSTDPNRSDFTEYPYADVMGNAGVIDPDDPNDPHGPGSFPFLPTPKWDQWRAAALSCETQTYNACTSSSVVATPARHVYWYGKTAGEKEDPTAHLAAASHTHRNGFVPDPYFPSLSYPDAYICQPSPSGTFEVQFRKQSGVTYNGVYFIHGDVLIKNDVEIKGTIVATGSVRSEGQATFDVTQMIESGNAAPHTVYPAVIAGEDALIPDQSQFHTLGIIWAGRSFDGRASDEAGCIVTPSLILRGNFSVTYGITRADHPGEQLPVDYYPGSSPPPMFNEPDRGQMQPVPYSWRELGL